MGHHCIFLMMNLFLLLMLSLSFSVKVKSDKFMIEG
jgi:hypothetical protein